MHRNLWNSPLVPVFAAVVTSACAASAPPTTRTTNATPPIAEQRAHAVSAPGGTRNDPYYWLRDDKRQSREVLDYLRAENAYTSAVMEPTKAEQDQLYREMVARLQEEDASVPVFNQGFFYSTRYEKGKEYAIHVRRKRDSTTSAEQVLLDGNALSLGHDFYRFTEGVVSTDGNLLAYAEDTVGRNQYKIRVKNLSTGTLAPEVIENANDEVVWANDNKTLFYVARHPVTLLSYRVFRHELGTPVSQDVLVYEEKDNAFDTRLDKTKSGRFIMLIQTSTRSSEVLLVDANSPETAPKPLLLRARDHEYECDHVADRFVIRTNWDAPNFRIMVVPTQFHDDKSKWLDAVPHDPGVFVHDFAAYESFLAVSVRSGGLKKVQYTSWSEQSPRLITFDEPAYVTELEDTPDASTEWLRYSYQSMTTPETIYEINTKTGETKQRKRRSVLGGFDPTNYATEYLFAPARDGKKIPVSLVYRKDTPRDGTAPLLQYGYGSYGSSRDPVFSSELISLLDRGFVYARAHVRGGQELGRTWYEDGKLLNKKNTFTDFIDVTEHLVTQKYAAATRVFAAGGSAGGLLMGAVANMRPDRYRGMIVWVPFVDVVTTMLDESIPLTTTEFDEWGNPAEKTYYDYLLSYSPYDNIEAKDYPAMLVTTGLWDSQVQYYEPAKWVARLRATKTDKNLLLLNIDMEAGHGGRSGRYREFRDTARDYAFLLSVLRRPDSRAQSN